MWSNLPGGEGGKRYSVLRINHALTSHAYLGQFDTLEEAQAYCEAQAQRVRAFCTFQPVLNWEDRRRCGVEVKGKS